MRRLTAFLLAAVLVFGMISMAAAADKDPNYYYFTDRNGNEMMAPLNAFATYVVDFQSGNPAAKYEEDREPSVTLGLPDYPDGAVGSGDLTLGKGGVLTLGFDIAIYDGDGLDIYVFEAGPQQEATTVEVSNDLVTWYYVGTTKGSTAGVDLNGKVPEGAHFRYVRLTDTGENGNSGNYPGADIDAVSGLNVEAIRSDWANPEIQEAEEEGLIPSTLEDADLTKPISRAEFAAVCATAYEKLKGEEITPSAEYKFVDIAGNKNETYIRKAYAVNIAIGISDSEFAPDNNLSRQEMATMLTRMIKKYKYPEWTVATDDQYYIDSSVSRKFDDDYLIADWAKPSVYFLYKLQIIKGMSTEPLIFAPYNSTPEEIAVGYATATREQAIVMALRVYKISDII